MLFGVVPGDRTTAMPQDDLHGLTKAIPDSLTFSQTQVTFILGHSLRSIYQDVLQAPVPEHLKALVKRLEERYPP
jgi:Anti-sigma factor NepR